MANARFSINQEPVLISVLSGKGGVGKSIISLNLADRLAVLGANVLVVDADLLSGTQHILANVAPKHNAIDYITGSVTLTQAVTPVAENLDLLAAGDVNHAEESVTGSAAASFVNLLRADATGKYRAVIIDHGSGRSNHSATLAHGSDLNLLVTIPELTSITGAYALYKFLTGVNHNLNAGMIVNRIRTEEESAYIRIRFNELTDKFLGMSPSYFGAISEHESVRRSIASQTLLSQVDGGQAVTSEFSSIAKTLASRLLGLSGPGLFDIKSTINKSSATADTRG